MKKSFRFLATSDWHSDLNLISAIEQYVDLNSIDFVLFTGDLLEKNIKLDKMLKPFKDKQIFMVPGNHESKSALDLLEKHYNIHLIGNKPIQINEDIAIFGTNYLNVGEFGIPEQDVLDNMIANFNAIKDMKIKIQLNHIPPHETQMGNASPFLNIFGSPALRIFLENFEPDITFVGHIHESSGLEEIVNKTRVVNTAKSFKVFDVNVKSKKITEIKINN